MKEKTYSNQISISWVEFKATIYRLDIRRLINKGSTRLSHFMIETEQAPTGHRSSNPPLPNEFFLKASWCYCKLTQALFQAKLFRALSQGLKLSRTLKSPLDPRLCLLRLLSETKTITTLLRSWRKKVYLNIYPWDGSHVKLMTKIIPIIFIIFLIILVQAHVIEKVVVVVGKWSLNMTLYLTCS